MALLFNRTRLLFSVRIHGHQHVIAESGLQARNRAAFITTVASSAGDSDRADHLAIHNNRNSAGHSKEPELHQLSRVLTWIVLQLRRNDGSGLTTLQCSLRFFQGSTNIVVGLSITAFLMHECTVCVDDVDRCRTAMLCGESTAGLRVFFC